MVLLFLVLLFLTKFLIFHNSHLNIVWQEFHLGPKWEIIRMSQ